MATMTMDVCGPRIARPATRVTTVRAESTLRLTARGRMVVRCMVASLATLLIFMLLSLGKGTAVAATTQSPRAAALSHSVVVRSGETLWQIAARELPGTDPRDGIARIRTFNGMSTMAVLDAGQTLEIPTV